MNRLPEEQTAFAQPQAEAGASAAVVIRKPGICEQRSYRSKQRLAGLGVLRILDS